METFAAPFQEEETRRFRWMLVCSCGFHLLLAATWALAPTGQGAFTLPGEAVVVELVASLSAPAPAAPAPARPAPPVHLPPEAVVLPETPGPLDETRPPPADLSEVLKRLRSEADESAPPLQAPSDPPAGDDAPRADPQPSGVGLADDAAGRAHSAELDWTQRLWIRKVDTHVRPFWVLPPELRDQNLYADALVLLDATGAVRRVTLRRSSGNIAFDSSVERALYRASPLPVPPEPGNWTIRMTPRRELP